jgi:hypothetical protein
MKLIKCGIEDFSRQTEQTKVVCFGASANINTMFCSYLEFGLAKRIVGVADNDKEKHGSTFHTWFNDFPVISIETLVEWYKLDQSLSLLIMTYACDEVYKQLDEIADLDEMKCYIYLLFPYYDHFPELPSELLRLREGEPCIPKVIHCCWFGSELPSKDKQYIDSWRSLLPEYQIQLWNEDNYDVYKHPFTKDAYDKGAYGFVSDYARFDIVYQYGGLYFDTDVEVIKNMDDLLFSESFFGLTLHSEINSGQGFGAKPGSTLLSDIRDVYNGVVHKNIGQTTSKNAFIETLPLRKRGYIGGNRFFISDDTVVYPVEFFSPKSSIFGIPTISDNCYSIHHFAYSWATEELRKTRKNKQSFFNELLGSGTYE